MKVLTAKMSSLCLICNDVCKTDIRSSRFVDKSWKNRKVVDLLSEIVEKPMDPKDLHSELLCSKCYDSCITYETYNQIIKTLKEEMQVKFKKTLSLYSSKYNKSDSSVKPAPTVKMIDSKVVVQASKLMPCTPDMLSKVGKALAMSATNRSPAKNESQTILTRVVSAPVKNSKKAMAPSMPQVMEIQALTLDESLGTMEPMEQPSILTSNTNMNFDTMNFSALPNDFLEKNCDDYNQSDNQNNVEEVDEEMEIEEDCNEQMNDNDDSNEFIQVYIENDKDAPDEGKPNFLDLNLLTEADEEQGQYIVSKLQILNKDDDEDSEEPHTIVMDSENGSILRVVGGNKLMYGDEEISLTVMPQNDDGQSQDSNEDSQIELQVSGDEETAHAIIAAAREEGGAFIKVGSGEMFRVKSVESKTVSDDEEEEGREEDRQLVDYLVREENGSFHCLLCEKENEAAGAHLTAEAMMRHARAQHAARLYICRVCGHLTRRKASHVLHMDKHTTTAPKSIQTALKNKLHQCDICKKKFTSKTLLSEHMNLHNGTMHTCDTCKKSFVSKYSYQAHLKTHTNRPRPFKCSQCSKAFLTNQNLLQHEKTHLGIKNFFCKICGKAFGSQHNLEIHGIVHTGQKPHVCSTCNKGFARRAELRDHERTHTGERPFVCGTCGASFSQSSNLLSHRRATHTDDRRYGCHLCTKKFKRRRLLQYHIKSSHTGERPLRCEECGATFVYPEHYKKHRRIHSGEKPYVCEVCGKSFNSRDNRNTHRFVHSDKKPYECLVCTAGYMRKNLLYAHMNLTGHLAESIVVNQPRVAKVTENVTSTESLVVDSIKVKPEKLDPLLASPEMQQEKTVKLLDGNQIQIKTETDFLEVITAEQLERAQIVANDENGEMVRLVQIQLPDGNNGWVAINP